MRVARWRERTTGAGGSKGAAAFACLAPERVTHELTSVPRPGTQAGTSVQKIPKLRSGSYFPEFLQCRRTAEEGPDRGHPR
jgi:transposase-like protein